MSRFGIDLIRPNLIDLLGLQTISCEMSSKTASRIDSYGIVPDPESIHCPMSIDNRLGSSIVFVPWTSLMSPYKGTNFWRCIHTKIWMNPSMNDDKISPLYEMWQIHKIFPIYINSFTSRLHILRNCFLYPFLTTLTQIWWSNNHIHIHHSKIFMIALYTPGIWTSGYILDDFTRFGSLVDEVSYKIETILILESDFLYKSHELIIASVDISDEKSSSHKSMKIVIRV